MASPPTKVTETAKEKKKRNNRRSNVNWDEPLEPELEAPDEPPELESASEDDACNDPETPYKERSIWSGHLRDAFVRSLVIPSPQSGDLGCTFTPPENTGPWEDFTPVFLKQARLYVLADKYGIDLLCQLVLSKLHQTLRTFKLYDTGKKVVLLSVISGTLFGVLRKALAYALAYEMNAVLGSCDVYDIWMPDHLKRIRSVIDEIPRGSPSFLDEDGSQPSQASFINVCLSDETATPSMLKIMDVYDTAAPVPPGGEKRCGSNCYEAPGVPLAKKAVSIFRENGEFAVDMIEKQVLLAGIL
ncbi:hypothetical protein BDFG_03522 [Blastomyces dermatitidis ATCC 26199]|nr:hypothetical protein BDFG_03522 [Blastomyces dermatitidis ATCC 26199]